MTTFEELKRKSAWPPASNGMPDLGDDYPDTLLWQYFAAAESLDGELHSLAVNFARLSDKAIREYRAARASLTAFLETLRGVEVPRGPHAPAPSHRPPGELHRRHKTSGGLLQHVAFEGVTTEENRKMLKELHHDLRKFRNSIQHADGDFGKGRIPEGDPLFPAMTSDCLYFAGGYVPYAEIAALVIEVWQLANIGIKAVTTG